MNFTEAKAKSKELEDKVSQLGEILRQYPRNEMGLTCDSVKFSDAYRADKSNFDKAFQKLRQFNKVFVKDFKYELAQERKNKRLAQINGTC